MGDRRKDDEYSNADVPDSVLIDIFSQIKSEDPSIENRLKKIFFEFKGFAEAGDTVDRRAPLYYLLPNKTIHVKKDPALKNPTLKGRLITLLITTSALIFIFLQSLVYSDIRTALNDRQDNYKLSGLMFYELGALHANAIRQGQWYRIFWSCWLHSGWFHLIFNILCQCQFFYMYEPDWGILRSFLIFFISGINGNLLSLTADPCSLSVGSSGGLFGLIGAIFVYCAEYWYTIPRPLIIILFSIIVIIISILDGFTGNTNNWAHLGGLCTGFLFSMMTTTYIKLIQAKGKPALQKEANCPSKTPRNVQGKCYNLGYSCYNYWFSQCSCHWTEWTIRIIGFLLLLAFYLSTLLLFYVYNEYKPIGSIRFKNSSLCTCCYLNLIGIENPKSSGVPFYCFTDTFVPDRWSMSWAAFCKLSFDEMKNSGLSTINQVGQSL